MSPELDRIVGRRCRTRRRPTRDESERAYCGGSVELGGAAVVRRCRRGEGVLVMTFGREGDLQVVRVLGDGFEQFANTLQPGGDVLAGDSEPSAG
jgi:hypothetical protein